MNIFKICNNNPKPACHCKTLQERFDNDDWLGDALAENMDLVRNIRMMIPDKGQRILSAGTLSETERKLLAQNSLNLINAIEDYMADPEDEPCDD